MVVPWIGEPAADTLRIKRTFVVDKTAPDLALQRKELLKCFLLPLPDVGQTLFSWKRPDRECSTTARRALLNRWPVSIHR